MEARRKQEEEEQRKREEEERIRREKEEADRQLQVGEWQHCPWKLLLRTNFHCGKVCVRQGKYRTSSVQ